jgi:hypothetical protein
MPQVVIISDTPCRSLDGSVYVMAESDADGVLTRLAILFRDLFMHTNHNRFGFFFFFGFRFFRSACGLGVCK